MLGFQGFNNLLVNLKSLFKHIIRNWRIRTEKRISYYNQSWVLTAEPRNGNCWRITNVELEMDQTNRENVNIARMEGLEEELVVGAGRNEPD